MEFNKHKHRNQTNRNLIVIAVGFLATVMAGTVVFQSYVSKASELNKRRVTLIIDNQTSIDSLTYTFSLGSDTSFSKKLALTKDTNTVKLKGKSKQLVKFDLDNSTSISDSVWVRDSIGYVFITIKNDSLPTNTPLIYINSTF